MNGTSTVVPEGAGEADFFPVAPNRMSREGGHGLDSRNIRRPAPSSACYQPATVDSCAP